MTEKKGKTTVMIHVDALRHDYVTPEDMPFLHGLADTGISGSLVPPFGFEPDGTYLTGRYPEEYEGGTHFVFSPETSPYRFARYIPAWIDRLGPYVSYAFRHHVIRRLIARFAKNERVRCQSSIARVPFKFLPYLDLCETHYAYESGAFNGCETIYDVLRKNRKKWFYHGAPNYRVKTDAVVDRVRSELDGGYDFAFLFLGDLDGVGHIFGPESAERRIVARQVDDGLRKIYDHIRDQYEEVDFIAFGDHGMVEVHDGLDVQSVLHELPLKPGVDYVYFLDSTFARFWYLNERAEPVIREALSGLKGGRIVSEQEHNEYHINFRDRKFGDLIYWVDDGVMLHPEFWHFRHIKKGMHGYRREVINNHAAFVFNTTSQSIGEKLSAPIDMTDMFATAVASLGLEKPQQARGINVREYLNADA